MKNFATTSALVLLLSVTQFPWAQAEEANKAPTAPVTTTVVNQGTPQATTASVQPVKGKHQKLKMKNKKLESSKPSAMKKLKETHKAA